MDEKEVVKYMLKVKGQELLHRLANYLILVNWRLESIYGRAPLNLKLNLRGNRVFVENINEIVNGIDDVDVVDGVGGVKLVKVKGELQVNLPDSVKEVIEQVLNEVLYLDDITLNDIVLYSLRFKREIGSGC